MYTENYRNGLLKQELQDAKLNHVVGVDRGNGLWSSTVSVAKLKFLVT